MPRGTIVAQMTKAVTTSTMADAKERARMR